MAAQFRDAKFDEGQAKLIGSLQEVGDRKPDKRAEKKVPVLRARRSEPKAKDTAAATRILQEHARRRKT